jgi:CheY-like chemotaxis protein
LEKQNIKRERNKMANTKILVVEDEIIIAKDIQNTLKTLGYDAPAIVLSGEEAIKKTEEIKPDLVLMNITLKGEIDGIEAAAEIRHLFNIPVVYLTGYMDEERLKRAKTTEPFSYVIKPFNERELHSAIVRALNKTWSTLDY